MSEDANLAPSISETTISVTEFLPNDKDLLSRLLEYVKYLYEEENERRDVLNNTTKIFLGTYAFVVGVGLIKIIAIENLPPILLYISNGPIGGKYIAFVATAMFLLSGGLFCASFLFTVLVVKIWKRERLCDPQQFVFRSMQMSDEPRLLSAIVADFVVATNRNHRINEQKARLLSKALFSFVSAFIVFTVTWVLLQTVNIIWRTQ